MENAVATGFNPIFFGRPNLAVEPEFVESCVITYCISDEHDPTSLTFDKLVVEECITSNRGMKPMEILSILFDFADVVKTDVGDNQYILSLRKLYAIGFFTNEIAKVAKEWLIEEVVRILRIATQIPSINPELTKPVVSGVAFILHALSSRFRDRVFCSKAQLSELLRISLTLFSYVTIPGVFMRSFQGFFLNCVFMIDFEQQHFMDVMKALTSTMNDDLSDAYNYVSFVNELLSHLEMIQDFDSQFVLFRLICLICAKNESARQFLSDEQNEIIIVDFLLAVSGKIASENVPEVVPLQIERAPACVDLYTFVTEASFSSEIVFTDHFESADNVDFEINEESRLSLLLDALFQTFPMEMQTQLLNSVLSRQLKMLGQHVLVMGWVKRMLIFDIDKTVCILTESGMLRKILNLNYFSKALVCYLLQNSSQTKFLRVVFEKFEDSVLGFSVSDECFETLCLCCVSQPSKVRSAMKTVNFAQRLANILFVLRNCHISNPCVSQLEHIRRKLFYLINVMVFIDGIKEYLLTSTVFLETLYQMAFEANIERFTVKCLCTGLSFMKSDNKSMHFILQFFQDRYADVSNLRAASLCRTILETVASIVPLNPHELGKAFLRNSFLDTLTDFVVFSRRSEDLWSLFDMFQCFSELKKSMRNYWLDSNPFVRLAPIIEHQLEENTTETLSKLWSIICGGKACVMDIPESIKNPAPLSLIFNSLYGDNDKCVAFLNELCKICEGDLESALEVALSDFPSKLLQAVTDYRMCGHSDELFCSVLKTLRILSAHTMSSKDLLSVFQSLTPIHGNFKPFFTLDMLEFLEGIFDSDNNAPCSFITLAGENQLIKLPDIELQDSFSEFYFWVVIQFNQLERDRYYEFFHIETSADTVMKLIISNGKTIVIHERGCRHDEYVIDSSLRKQKWRVISFGYKDEFLTFYSNGVQVSKAYVPALSFSDSLRKWYLARDLNCSVSSFGFLNASLDYSLIKLLGEFPFMYVTTFNKAEACEFSEKYQRLFLSGIMENALVIFNAAIHNARELINLSSRFNCPCEHNGELYSFSLPPRSILPGIGGLSTLFPLFSQLDMPIRVFDGEHGKLLPSLIDVLTKVLITSHRNQEEFASISGFEAIASLMMRASISHLTKPVIEKFVTLYSSLECKELRRQLLLNVFFNVGLWIYLPIEIQEFVFQCLCNIFDQESTEKRLEISQWIPLAEIITRMKMCLWSKQERFSLFAEPKSHSISREIEAERPADVASIRKKIWEFAERLYLSDADCEQLCFFASDTIDPLFTVEVINFLIKLVDTRDRVLMHHVGADLHFKRFFPIFVCENEELRMMSLHLFFSLCDQSLRFALHPYSTQDWLNAIITTINLTNTTSESADVVFGYFYGLYEGMNLRIRISKEIEEVAYLPQMWILPLCMSVVVSLEVADAVPFVRSLFWCAKKHAVTFVEFLEWDHPFLQYLIHRLPNTKTEVSDDCKWVLKTLTTLYMFSAIRSGTDALTKVAASMAMFAAQSVEDISHIHRMLLMSLCKRLLKIKVREFIGLPAVLSLITNVFEFLFLVPTSDRHFAPPFAMIVLRNKGVTYQTLQRMKLNREIPKIKFIYATRTNEKGIWEDAELALALVQVFETVPEVLTISASINPLFMFSFVVGVGLQHECVFHQFSKSIHSLIQYIPSRKFTVVQVTAFTNYMQGLVKTYLRTDRQHQSHLYLLEHARAYSELIDTVFKLKVEWGTSMDSFDACFVQGYNFGHAIIERFVNVSENFLVKNAKQATRVANESLQNVILRRADGFDRLNTSASENQLSQSNAQSRLLLENAALRLKQSQYEGIKTYQQFWKTLSSDRGPWCAPESSSEHHWKLHKTFQGGFKRGLMKQNLKYTKHETASDRTTETSNGRESQEIWKTLMFRDFAGDRSFIACDLDEISHSHKILMKLDSKLIGMKSVQSGTFLITDTRILFESSQKYLEIELDTITMVLLRHYLLLNNAIEIFLPHRSYFFDFVEGQRPGVLKILSKLRDHGKMKRLVFLQMAEYEIKTLVADATAKWQHGTLSNFDYLMLINIYSGRTFNDLSKYPVMPWVIADYTSETLDMKKQETYRDLRKPIGTYSSQRLNAIKKHVLALSDPQNRYFFGSFYSSAAVVIGFLVRMEPFASLHIELQGGKFDFPERLFSSISRAWDSATTENMDFRELIPEFFYLPDFLKNENNFDFGKGVDDVELPPWAKSPQDFVHRNREVLESPIVTMMLPAWIDAIWGITSRGKRAAEIDNVFNPLFFEEMRGEQTLELRQEFAACFGQAPAQLFLEAHPNRPIGIRRLGTGERKLFVIYEPSDIRAPPIIWIDSFGGTRLLVNKNFQYTELGGKQAVDGDLHMSKGIVRTSKYVAVCSSAYDSSFSVIDLETAKIHAIKRFHTLRITSISMSDEYFVTGSLDCTVVIWRLIDDNGRMVPTIVDALVHHRSSVTCVDINYGANLVASCSRDGSVVTSTVATGGFIKIENVIDEGEPVHVKVFDSGTVCVCFIRDSKSTIICYDQNLHHNGRCAFEDQVQLWTGFEWYDGMEYLVVALQSNQIVCLKLPQMQPIWKVSGVDFNAQSLAVEYETSSILFGNSYGKVIAIPLE